MSFSDFINDPALLSTAIERKIRLTLLFNNEMQSELLLDLKRMLKSRVQVLEAFKLFTEIYDDHTKDACQAVIKTVNEGKSVSEGMTGWFSDEVILSVKIGEENGILDKTLDNVINYLKVSSAGFSMFVAKALYPFFIFCFATFIAGVMDTEYYPVIQSLLEESQWPPIVVSIYHFWGGFLSFRYVVLLSFLTVGIAFYYALINLVGPRRDAIDGYPIFNQYRMKQSSIFLRLMGLMISNAVPMSRALRELEANATPYLRSHLLRMQRRVRVGRGSEADYFNTGLVDKKMIKRLKVLAGTSDFSIAMQELGDASLDIVDKRMMRSANAFGYLMLFVAAMALASAFIGPLLLSQSLQNLAQ